MLQCQFLKLVSAWRIAYTLRVRESLRGLWCNTRCCDIRLACLHPLPCGDPDHQCQSECQQRHDEVASGVRHSAHHGLLRCGMRSTLFELVKHLIDDTHCSTIHAIPNDTIAAAPVNAAAQGNQSRLTSGVSAAASRTCLDNTCCLPSLNVSINAL